MVIYKKKGTWRYIFHNGVQRGWIKKGINDVGYSVNLFNRSGSSFLLCDTFLKLKDARRQVARKLK